jgi:peptide/nickel transport system ATP-binding protein
VRAVDKLSYQIRKGEILGVVGESGSGKSQSSMSIIGLLPRNGHATGSVVLHQNGVQTQLIDAPTNVLQKVRGSSIGTIFQEPMTALNPVFTIGFQIIETIRNHTPLSIKVAREKAIELLKMVEIPDPEASVDKYPHQLSGGQRQRVMIAQALALDPLILIADEPTTALDVTVQAEILALMRDLMKRVDTGIILITHDMGVIAEMADNICVMKDGNLVEGGTTEQIFYAPVHPYTKELLASVPRLKVGTAADIKPAVIPDTKLVFDAQNLIVEYPKRGRIKAFRAIEDFNLQMHKGEVVGLVGESGSGKTTVGRAAVGLLPVHSGKLVVSGVDISNNAKKAVSVSRRDVSIVFQDPGSSLNPRLPIGESIGESVLLHLKDLKKHPELIGRTERSGIPLDRKGLPKYVEALLDQVRLPISYRNRFPHELSGGQRQRVGIARALALKPQLLIADEPTSALDVSVQAVVLDLFMELQEEFGFGCLFISHDLAVVEKVSSRIVVLSKGKIVESGSDSEILYAPQQDYTKALIDAVPIPDPKVQKSRRRR